MKKLIYITIICIIAIFCTGCNKKTNYGIDYGTLTCSQVKIGDDGYNSIFTYIISYKNDIIFQKTNILTQECDANSIDLLYGFYIENTEFLENIEGFEHEVYKSSDNSITLIQKANFEKLDKEKFFTTLTDNNYENNGKLITSLKEYKENFITEDMICK